VSDPDFTPAFIRTDWLTAAHGARLYYQYCPPQLSPHRTFVWLSGFRSDISGAKAQLVLEHALRRGDGALLVDYSGHGRSAGDFADGTISLWLADALAAIKALTQGPLILVGSSMGGWIALLAALRLPARIAGLALVAPAPDFTERLIWRAFPDEIRAAILRDGVYCRPSAYDPAPTPITRALIEDARQHLIMDNSIPIHAPVRILHGQQDPDVPWAQSLELVERLASTDVRLTLIKDGDHRLSRPEDLALLRLTLDPFIDNV